MCLCVRIQKDDSPLNPYMYVLNDGTVTSEEDLRVVSACRMDVISSPSTHRSATSPLVDELRILPFSNASRATQFSREVIKSQGSGSSSICPSPATTSPSALNSGNSSYTL
ncbi:hypothetical protein F7725_014495 [Dissostichus mawsoni]|uniref:Uncharacterized protein n=1 Tax=Dissostichus mawsoni TaxID=36200 RepID=A0A7J5YZ63_DISMA|nr:hypothetical protein F7725_014495 [Dissostichus mawsoni]